MEDFEMADCGILGFLHWSMDAVSQSGQLAGAGHLPYGNLKISTSRNQQLPSIAPDLGAFTAIGADIDVFAALHDVGSESGVFAILPDFFKRFTF